MGDDWHHQLQEEVNDSIKEIRTSLYLKDPSQRTTTFFNALFRIKDKDQKALPADTQLVMSRNSKVAILGVNASHQGTIVDYNVERLKNHLVASQDLSKELSSDMFSPKVSVRFGLKKENVGHQALARNKCSRGAADKQKPKKLGRFSFCKTKDIVVHQDVRFKKVVENGNSRVLLEAMCPVIVMIWLGRLPPHSKIYYACKC